MTDLDSFFEDICRKNYNNIYKYAYFSLKNKAAAEDITQDTFVHVYKNIKKIHKHDNPVGYIFRTAQNFIKNYKKQLYRRIAMEQQADERFEDINDVGSGIDSVLDAEINEYEYIIYVIGSLSEEKRRLYDMYYVENRSMKEISDELGISYAALRMKYVRLRKEIKDRVRETAEKYFVT